MQISTQRKIPPHYFWNDHQLWNLIKTNNYWILENIQGFEIAGFRQSVNFLTDWNKNFKNHVLYLSKNASLDSEMTGNRSRHETKFLQICKFYKTSKKWRPLSGYLQQFYVFVLRQMEINDIASFLNFPKRGFGFKFYDILN